MALPEEKLLFSTEQYLEFEREAEERSEYYDGYIVKMAGESLSHSRICMNLAGEMRNLLRGKPCEALSPNMKVRSENKGMFAYPDLTVVCGEPVFHDRQRDVLLNPRVIFEVLSPSTGRYDRNAKRNAYLKIPSLRDYLVVSQDTVFIEHDFRAEGGSWERREYGRRTDLIQLNSLEIEVPVAEIYRRLDLPEGAA